MPDVRSKNWTRENLAWLAGLYEGEGTIAFRTYKSTGTKQITFRITMTDEDVIRRAHEVAGVGHVYGPYQRTNATPSGNRYKPQYVWSVTTQGDVVAICAAIWPWLYSRRQQTISDCLTYWRTAPARARNKNGQFSNTAVVSP